MKKNRRNQNDKYAENPVDYENLNPIDQNLENDLNMDLEELSEGDDPIEMDILEADKIVFGASFSPMDGNDGDESEDNNDLPSEFKKMGHTFNQTISGGGRLDEDSESWEEGLFINEIDDLGIGLGDNDYSDDYNNHE